MDESLVSINETATYQLTQTKHLDFKISGNLTFKNTLHERYIKLGVVWCWGVAITLDLNNKAPHQTLSSFLIFHPHFSFMYILCQLKTFHNLMFHPLMTKGSPFLDSGHNCKEPQQGLLNNTDALQKFCQAL